MNKGKKACHANGVERFGTVLERKWNAKNRYKPYQSSILVPAFQEMKKMYKGGISKTS
jgi:hypothetical protein